MKKLLVVSGNSVHTVNYIKLIDGYFDEVLVITNKAMEGLDCTQVEMDFSLRNPLKLVPGIKKIRQVIHDFNPTVIHLQQAATHAYMAVKAAKGSNIPIVLTPWGSDILLNPKRGIIFRQMVKTILNESDYITSFGQHFGKAMIELMPHKKLDISYVRWGIDTEKAIIGPKENIIYSNRLHNPLYRVDKIIEAYAALPKEEISKWKLLVAGTGTETEYLKELCNKLGIADKVEFCGWISREQNFENYRKSKIYVSIPISDSMPISLQEAMLHGCLPVLSDLPANREITQAPGYGVIVEDVNKPFLSDVINWDIDVLVKDNTQQIKNVAALAVSRAGFLRVYDKALNTAQ
ncbi:MAG: glycosyltransferase family 4 protein [Sphingobacteriales bacterium JAD_PAG50586_3]|nr:MAG: glycosyltransferase family 4 protein [Sphingobacteriales bacterium JAD_PAG50586_3]